MQRLGSVHQGNGFEYMFVCLCAAQIRDKGMKT